MTTAERVLCSSETMTWNDRTRGYLCPKPATGDDGLCGLHRNVQRRKAEREERWRRADERFARQLAQSRYVKMWREQHPQRVYTTIWDCPLCGRAIQCAAVGLDPHGETGAASFLARRHQQTHGSDWTAYMALAAEAQGPGGAGGGEG